MPDTRHPSPDTRRDTRGRAPLPPLVPLSRVAPEPVPWLSPGRIAAGAITLLDGDPGVGKSTLLCDFAARISVGDPLPGGQPARPAAALLMSSEDDPYAAIRPRIDAAAGDPSRVYAFGVLAELGPGGALLRLPEHVDILREVIARLDAALVVIDPLVAFLSPRLNTHSDQAVRRALAALKTVAEQTGAAVLAVRHLNKNVSANPLYRGGGSIGLLAAARTALLLAPDPADPGRRILAPLKSNLGPLPPSLAFRLEPVPGSHAPRIAWEGESPHSAADLLRPPLDPFQPWSAIHEAREWLRAALAAGPRPAHQLLRESRQAGIARSTLYAAKRAESIRAEKAHTPDGPWLWTPVPPQREP